MPRGIRVRDAGEEPQARRDAERRQWLSQWKKRAVDQLPPDTPRSLKVQLRTDVEQALAHFRAGDNEEEVRDVVEGALDDTLNRLASVAADERHKVSKGAMIVLTPLFLRIALSKQDRRLVTEMLKQPESSRAVLTVRLKWYLARHLRGDEDHDDVQGLVDVWVACQLAKHRTKYRRPSRIPLGTASAVAAPPGLAAYQLPPVKTAVHRGLAKAQKFLEQLKPSSPPTPPPTQGPADVTSDH